MAFKENGNCLDVAVEALLLHRGPCWIAVQAYGTPNAARLVMAMVNGRGPASGVRFFHAWLESDGTVFDYSNGNAIVWPVARYYALGGIVKTSGQWSSYSRRELATMANRHRGKIRPYDLIGLGAPQKLAA